MNGRARPPGAPLLVSINQEPHGLPTQIRCIGRDFLLSTNRQGFSRNVTSIKTSIQSVATATLTVIGFALLPEAHAVVPPPDGGDPGGNAAEGQNALFSLTTGAFNICFHAKLDCS